MPRVPLRFVCAAVALWLSIAFLALGSEVMEGETAPFDVLVLTTAQAWRAANPWITEVMRDLSGVGSTTVLTLITVATTAYLASFRSLRLAVALAGAVCGAALVMRLAKHTIGRLRPDLGLAEFAVSGYSFPSGHSSMSMVVLLCVATAVAPLQQPRAQKAFVLLAASTLAMLVGVSRAALGVHWATDVLAGWLFGAAWSAAATLLFSRLTTPSSPSQAPP